MLIMASMELCPRDYWKSKLQSRRGFKKRAHKIISRGGTTPLDLHSLQSRREQAAIQLVKEMNNNAHPLQELLPKARAEN